MTIRTKLILILTSVLIISVIGADLTSYIVSKRALRQTALTETLPLIATSIYSEIQRAILRPVHVSSLMANDTFLKDWVTTGEQDTTKIVRYLDEIKQRYGFYSSFFVSEQTGNYYYYDGIFKTISPENDHDVWYYDFKAKNTEYDLDVDHDEVTSNTLTVFINHRLLDADGRFLGVTGVGLKMEYIGELLAAYREQYRRLIFMVDSDGLVQIHPNEALIESAYLNDMPQFAAIADTILAGREGINTHITQYDGGSVFLSTQYLGEFDWFLVVMQYESDELGQIRTSLAISLLMGLGATVFVIFVMAWAVTFFQGKLELLATTDSLTGVSTRSHFLDIMEKERLRAKRTLLPYNLLVIDLDNFKRVNDTHGHGVGDQVLRQLSGIMAGCLRETDTLGRIGGEEFAVLLPETGSERAQQVAERLRQVVAEKSIDTPHGSLQLSVSIGVAESKSGDDDFAGIYNRADRALYQAKDAGRNRVVVSGSGEAPRAPENPQNGTLA